MRTATAIGLITIGMLWQGATGAEAQTCQPDGEVQFLCGPVSPEDLAPVPQSPWVIVSSMVDEGHLYLADIRDHRSTVIFPTDTSRPRHDITRYGACPGPVSRQFRPHGLNLHPGDSGRHTLYVVGHGEREAIEVFEVDMDGAAPTLTWVGCAVAPEELGLNSVVALPEGGFAATSPRPATCGNGAPTRGGAAFRAAKTSARTDWKSLETVNGSTWVDTETRR